MLSVATLIGLAALSIALPPIAEPLTETAVLDSPARHVRAADRSMRHLIKTGFRHSPTFATLLARLERSDLIVYVQEVSSLPNGIEGRMLLLPRAHGQRYVRIQIASRGTPSEAVALLAHELQHALEVADNPDVIDDDALEALYRRIGVREGHNWYDTVTARETGRRVLRELV
jgi:hypothetical protein